MRPDGRIAKGMTAIEMALPHIMPKRVDSQNFVTEYIDEEIIKEYIRTVRNEKGIHLSRMSVIIAAYHQAAVEHPYINRFVANSKIYDRNHFCVSFVMLKNRVDGTPDETSVKVFMDPEDDVYDINRKITEQVEENSNPSHNNNTDKFASLIFKVPLLPYAVMGLVRLLDRYGLLPRFIIDLSPFHTSMFITNLASINTSHIYHHVYEFGTTSVFLSVGKSLPNYIKGTPGKKMIPMSIVMDERICTGHDYAVFNRTFQRYLKDPYLLDDVSAAKTGAQKLRDKTAVS